MSQSSLVARVKELCKFASPKDEDHIISGLKWMGLFSADPATVRAGTTLDTLCAQLEKLLTYQPGERDMVMLQHKFVIEWKDGSKVLPRASLHAQTYDADPSQETRTSTLEAFGDPKGASAMSHAVGVPCGIAAQLLLDGTPALKQPGILQPYTPEICDPIRLLAEKEGLGMVEATV